jgi:hypothetical protein
VDVGPTNEQNATVDENDTDDTADGRGNDTRNLAIVPTPELQ